MGNFFIFLFIISSVSSQNYRHFSVKTGESVTIPCRYDMKYIRHKKYWCSGTLYSSCTIEAYANQTRGNVRVTDHPAERLFTVTMKNLQTGNTGWYWCVVEISGGRDDAEYLYITVKSDPDLSVMESRVSAEEGGSVTVQCLYSTAYQKTQKQWCRFKDRRCDNMGTTPTSQNSAVQIRDDGKQSFSVQMSGLKKSDAGWYWCRAGDLQVPVHISVTDPLPVLTSTVTSTVTLTSTHHVSNSTSVSNHSSATTVSKSTGTKSLGIHWYLLSVLLLLVILVIIVIIIIIVRRKKGKAETQTRSSERSTDATVPTAENELLYSTIDVKSKKNKSKERNVEQAENELLYSTIDVKSKKNKSKERNVEQVENELLYSTIDVKSKKKKSKQRNVEQVSPNDVDNQTIYSNVVV